MMRRASKKQKPAAEGAPVAPPVPGSGASLPPRPKGLNAAAESLGRELGVAVAAGFGFGNDPKDRSQAWRLFCFSTDPKVPVPADFQGFPVSRREVPTISPAWGKAAHRHQRRD